MGEKLDEFLQRLKTLSTDCRALTIVLNKEAATRGVLVAGLFSGYRRQRFLEDAGLELRAVCDKARSLDYAQRNAEVYSSRSAMPPGTVASRQPTSETKMQC